MDIRDEIKLSKGDMSLDSDETKHQNKLPGVKAIDRVSSIKSKSKVTGKSNSPKSRKESEKAAVVKENFVVSKSKVAAVVSEKSNSVKESVVKSIEKSTVVKERDVTSKVGKSNVSAVVSEKSDVDEKDNPKSDKETEPVVVAKVKASVVAAIESVVEKDNSKVTSKVSDEIVKAPIVKESVKVPVVKKSVKASSVVIDRSSSVVADKVDVVIKKSVKASSVVADKPSSVVADKVDVVVKKSVKASSVVADKPSSVVADKVDVVKDNINVVADKASDALKNKPTGKGKKPVVGKDKDKAKNIAPDVVKEKFQPNPKQKVILSRILVLRLSKQEENPEFKAKVNVKRKMILSKEDDRKKKWKGKSKKDVSDYELETDVVDYSSDEADRKRKKLKIKAGLKRKRSGSDSLDSLELDIKSKKKSTKKVEKEESDKESVPKKVKKKEKQLTPTEAAHEEYLLSFPSFHARTTPCSLFSAIKNSRVDILRFLTDRGFSSLHNISIDHLPSKLGRFTVSKFKSYMLIFDLGEKIKDLIKKAKEKLSLIYVERVMLEDYIRKASLKCPGDGKFVALHEKYVNLFIDPISFEDDGNVDNVGDDDDENGDDDGGNVDNDANDCDGNRDEEDVNKGDKDPNGSNPSFGFSKISLEDFGNDSGPAEKDKVVEGNPTEQGTVVEGNQAEECEIMTPGLWLDANVIDCWGTVLNHEESFRATESKSKHFFQPSKPMFDGTLASFDAKWESLSNQVNAQFKGNKGGLTLGGIDLYGHIRHTQVAKVKHTIPKLKWNTKENFHDCGIFTMLHMETFNGRPASNLDCGLPVESQLQLNMLRRLRFKFATKILFHEINVYAGKMLELAKEFDKIYHVEKIAIIVDAFKKREERDCI
nr:hypothetical protein [Tanacetum cinerariifolium]